MTQPNPNPTPERALARRPDADALRNAGPGGAAPVGKPARAAQPDITVLAYRRFGERIPNDPLAVSGAALGAQLAHLRRLGYRFVPLRDVVAWLLGAPDPLPEKSVVLTVDEGDCSIIDVLCPIALRERAPVTLFVHPPAIAGARDTLTWHQLRMLTDTGWFDVQAHAWWHPDFDFTRQATPSAEARAATLAQLRAARGDIEQKVGGCADIIAWPFGTYDERLASLAREAGYVAGCALGAAKVHRDTPPMALPRFPMLEACTPAVLTRLLGERRVSSSRDGAR